MERAGGCGRQAWCADAGQSRAPAAGEGMLMLPGVGCGSRVPPPSLPLGRPCGSDAQPRSPAAPETGSAAWDLCWQAGPFRLSGALGGGVKVAFWFRFLCRLPPPPLSRFIVSFKGFGLR